MLQRVWKLRRAQTWAATEISDCLSGIRDAVLPLFSPLRFPLLPFFSNTCLLIFPASFSFLAIGGKKSNGFLNHRPSVSITLLFSLLMKFFSSLRKEIKSLDVVKYVCFCGQQTVSDSKLFLCLGKQFTGNRVCFWKWFEIFAASFRALQTRRLHLVLTLASTALGFNDILQFHYTEQHYVHGLHFSLNGITKNDRVGT